MKSIALFLMIICAAAAAQASVNVQDKVLQKGLFMTAGCSANTESYWECACEADVHYPEITGLADERAQIGLNSQLEKMAAQAQCKGNAAEKVNNDAKGAAEKNLPSSSQYTYRTAFQSPKILALEFDYKTFEGGAHPNHTMTEVIVDLQKGAALTVSDLVAASSLPAVNQLIYDTLSAKPEGEVFHDEIEKRKGAFVTAKECQGCTLTLAADGIHVVFQTYEVASYAEGPVDVPVPAKYISNTDVVQSLAEKK